MSFFRRRKTPLLTDADAQILAQLQSHGADLSQAREVVHYVVSDKEAGLRAIAVRLEALGWNTKVEYSESYGSWLATATQEKVLDAEVAAKDRAVFESLAADLQGGVYDGWVAAV